MLKNGHVLQLGDVEVEILTELRLMVISYNILGYHNILK